MCDGRRIFRAAGPTNDEPGGPAAILGAPGPIKPLSFSDDGRRTRPAPGSLRMDAGDLRALDADTGHQPLLVEDVRVDVARERVRRHRLREALVDDDQARAAADLPAAGAV